MSEYKSKGERERRKVRKSRDEEVSKGVSESERRQGREMER